GSPQTISARMAGRTWTVSRSGTRPRDLLGELDGRAGIVDALVQGDHVRLVTVESTPPEAVVRQPGVVFRETPPRFEDGFIDLLHRGHERARTVGDDGAAREKRSSGNEVVIRVEGAKRRFGDFWAVDGVDFEIRRGEIFGLLGANGAGKTTTFRMLCGLLPASAGRLEVAGFDLRRAASTARARIGYM
ncbi:MAG: ATP-binding cassette domain-containing protein, partial [Gemmatimonadetes bacterium]|nr:ATP-binding cassette domain-containing protein [Gemmatimonadota bacterium]